jgi:hypothetical protein
LLRIAANVRFRTASHQHVLIRASTREPRALSARQKKRVRKSSGKIRFGWVSNVTQPLKEMAMNIRKLSIALLAGIATLVTVTEPTFAAQRQHRAYDAYASGSAADRSGAYYYGPGAARSEAPAVFGAGLSAASL